MRAVLQRVKRASVTVDGRITGSIAAGLLVFLGVGKNDTDNDIAWVADKLVNLRLFEDADGKMNRSVQDMGGQILLVSQFTLYGDCRKGRRPDFTAAGDPETARKLYEKTIAAVRDKGVAVETGIFAAHMDIESINDGPVTLVLDTEKS